MTVALPPVSLTHEIASIRGVTKQLNDYMLYGCTLPEDKDINRINAQIDARKLDTKKWEPTEILKDVCKFLLSQIATLPLYIFSAVAVAATVTFLPVGPLLKLAALFAVCRVSAIVWNGTIDSVVNNWLDGWDALKPSENRQLRDAAKEFKKSKDKLTKLEEYRRDSAQAPVHPAII